MSLTCLEPFGFLLHLKIQTPYLGLQAPPSPWTLLSTAFSLSSNPVASSVSNILSSFLSWTVADTLWGSTECHSSSLDWVVYSSSVSLNSTFLWRPSQAILSLNDLLCVFLCLFNSFIALFITYDNIYLLPLFILSPLLETPWGQKLFCSSICTQCLAHARASVNVKRSNPS